MHAFECEIKCGFRYSNTATLFLSNESGPICFFPLTFALNYTILTIYCANILRACAGSYSSSNLSVLIFLKTFFKLFVFIVVFMSHDDVDKYKPLVFKPILSMSTWVRGKIFGNGVGVNVPESNVALRSVVSTCM